MQAEPEKQGKSKQCTKCGETKPLTEFYKNKGGKYGVQSRCKVCANAYSAKYRAENPEYYAKYRAENREKKRACDAKYYAANRDKVRVRRARYYAENREKKKAYSAKYKRDNPEKRRANNQRYRAKKLNAPGTFTASDWKSKLEYYGYRCRYCGIHKSETNEGWLEADHAIPLSRGGTNWISNIVPACKSCNCSKHAKTFKEFLNEQKEV